MEWIQIELATLTWIQFESLIWIPLTPYGLGCVFYLASSYVSRTYEKWTYKNLLELIGTCLNLSRAYLNLSELRTYSVKVKRAHP